MSVLRPSPGLDAEHIDDSAAIKRENSDAFDSRCPASIFDRSRMSLMSSSRCLPLEWMVSRYFLESASFLL